jgi:hypothetical protein
MRVPPTSTRLADIPEAGRIAARPITRSHSCRWVRYARMPGRRGAMHHDSARRVFRGPAGKASGARSGRLELAGRFPPGANIDAAWATAIHALPPGRPHHDHALVDPKRSPAVDVTGVLEKCHSDEKD